MRSDRDTRRIRTATRSPSTGERAEPHDRRPPVPPRRVPPPVALVRRRGPRTDAGPERAREEPPDRRRNGPRGAQLRDLRSPCRERDRGILSRPSGRFRRPVVHLPGRVAYLLRGPAVHADVVRPACGPRSVTLMRGPRFGNLDPNARLRAEEGHGEDP